MSSSFPLFLSFRVNPISVLPLPLNTASGAALYSRREGWLRSICDLIYFFMYFYHPQYTVLHILSHCTSYSFYFIIFSLFHSHLYLYIYSLVLCFIAYAIFIFYFIIIIFFLHFPLSGPVLTYISLLIIPCMIVYVTNNKEPSPSHTPSSHP